MRKLPLLPCLSGVTGQTHRNRVTKEYINEKEKKHERKQTRV